MISKEDFKTAEALKDRLLAEANGRIRRIILYGSRAGGSATLESDFDFLVIETDPVAKREEKVRFRQALRDWTVPIDVWVMGETEFEETKGVIGGLAYPAHRYGVVLYEI